MTKDEGLFLLDVVGEELVAVEFNGEFYAMNGADAASMALDFLELGTTNLDN